MSSRPWDAKAGEVSVEEYAAIEAEERLVYEVQKAVRGLLKRKGVKAAELARLLGVSEARVNQMLGGEAKNLTLRTLARIHHVLGSRCACWLRMRPRSSEARLRGSRSSRPARYDPSGAYACASGAAIDSLEGRSFVVLCVTF